MPETPDDQVEVMITIDDQSLGQITTIVSALRKKGLKVGQVLESSGIVSGTARRKDFARLRQHAGVSALEVPGEVEIPPPDAEIQ